MPDLTVNVTGQREPEIVTEPLVGQNLPTFNDMEYPNFRLDIPEGSGGGIWDFVTSLLGGGGNNPLGMTSLIPALTAAWNQYNNAGQYGETAQRASEMASPVTLEERRRWQDRMRMLYENPQQFLDSSPEYQANKSELLRQINPRAAAQGFATGQADGGATSDQMRFISDLGSRFINQERNALLEMGGYRFSPASGAEMLMRGNEQEIAARNSALDHLFFPFGAGQGPGRGPTSNGGAGSMDQILRMILGGRTPAGMSSSQVGSIIASLPSSIRNLLTYGAGGAPDLEDIYGNIAGGNWNFTIPGGLEDNYGIGGNWNFDDYASFLDGLIGSGE